MHVIRSLLLLTWLVIIQAPLCAQDFDLALGVIQDEYDLAGASVVIFCDDSVLLAKNCGTANFNAGMAVNQDTKFRIASISKTITAMAFMQLVDDGSCSLDDDISTWLGYTVRNPNYPDVVITPRMLLGHTSTIIDGGNYDDFLSQTYSASNVPSLENLLSTNGAQYSNTLFNTSVPGTYFNYSNLNFGIVGTLIEAVSGVRFDLYCKQHIFDPLELDASFRIADLDNPEQLGALYRKQNGQWVVQADDFQDGIPNESYLNTYVPGTNALRFAPQGGLRISAIDLAKIFRVLLNDGTVDGTVILSSSAVDQMLAEEWTYSGNNGNNYYGLFRSWGLGVHRLTNTANQDIVLSESTSMYGHPGEAYGLVSDAYVDTVRDLGVIFITNGCGDGYETNGQSAFYTVEKDIFDLVSSFITGESCDALLNREEAHKCPEVTIFPNPAHLIANVMFDDRNTHHILLVDMQGAVLLEEHIFDEHWQLNSTLLPDGLYALVIDGHWNNLIVRH